MKFPKLVSKDGTPSVEWMEGEILEGFPLEGIEIWTRWDGAWLVATERETGLFVHALRNGVGVKREMVRVLSQVPREIWEKCKAEAREEFGDITIPLYASRRMVAMTPDLRGRLP